MNQSYKTVDWKGESLVNSVIEKIRGEKARLEFPGGKYSGPG
jgi:hypothetical protein